MKQSGDCMETDVEVRSPAATPTAATTTHRESGARRTKEGKA